MFAKRPGKLNIDVVDYSGEFGARIAVGGDELLADRVYGARFRGSKEAPIACSASLGAAD